MALSITLLLLSALFYNALLAVINAHVAAVSTALVMVTEAAILGAGLLLAAKGFRLDSRIKTALCFSAFFVILYIWNSSLAAIAGYPASLKPIRDISILLVFLIVGLCCPLHENQIRKAVLFATCLVITFLVLELLRTDLFVRIFNIASYYINTRGYDESVFANRGNTGLFFSSMSFDGRFTLGFRQAQRLSSLFLETTTLSNFAIVICVYLAALWERLDSRTRVFLLSSVALIILGTDSRQVLGIGALILIGYHIFPKLHKVALLCYMPLTLLMMRIFFYDPAAAFHDDNLHGRLGYSISRLIDTDIHALLGMKLSERVVDAGFAQIVYSQSLIGLVVIWLLLYKMLPYKSASGRRAAHSVMLFYTINLSVSGATIFSMKTSALLWFLIGYLHVLEQRRQLSPKYHPDIVMPIHPNFSCTARSLKY